MLSPFDAFTTKGCRTVSVGFTMSDSWRTAKWLVLQLHFDVVTCYDICQSWTKYRALYTGTWKQLECKLSNCLTQQEIFTTKPVEGNVTMYCFCMSYDYGDDQTKVSE